MASTPVPRNGTVKDAPAVVLVDVERYQSIASPSEAFRLHVPSYVTALSMLSNCAPAYGV